jgi:AcrR family transcriptional regulator
MNENIIVALERGGTVTATFRKLAPGKKKRIYHAALEAFSSDVFDRVSFDIIAQRGQVSKASLFQYFDNKENMLRFVCEIFLDDFESGLGEYFAREQAVRVRERIQSFLLSQFYFWSGEGRYYRFFVKMRHENSRELTGEFNRRISGFLTDRLKTILSRAARTGEIRQDIEAEAVAEIMLYILDGLTETILTGAVKAEKKDQMAARLDTALAILFDGLKG